MIIIYPLLDLFSYNIFLHSHLPFSLLFYCILFLSSFIICCLQVFKYFHTLLNSLLNCIFVFCIPYLTLLRYFFTSPDCTYFPLVTLTHQLLTLVHSSLMFHIPFRPEPFPLLFFLPAPNPSSQRGNPAFTFRIPDPISQVEEHSVYQS